MTIENVITKAANDLTDEQFLSRDIELIYDSVTDIYDLSKHDGIPLDSLNSMLRLLLEKMANAFNEIESNLSMYQFVEEIRQAKNEDERSLIAEKYKTARASRRVYEQSL